MKEFLRKCVRRSFRLYSNVYDALCGKHPHLRLWHFQWHALRDLNKDLSKALSTLEGDVLDMGCGMGPYRPFMRKVSSYTGCDVEDGPKVDVVIVPRRPMPFEDGAFDAIVCTQVFEHMTDLDESLQEIRRVLKPGGKFVVSAPFIYQVHGAPHDYRRLSEYGARRLLADFTIEEVQTQGAVGSALAILFLGWINAQLSANVFTWALKALLLPAWLPFCLLVNLAALILDKCDTTRSFYHNILVVARLQ